MCDSPVFHVEIYTIFDARKNCHVEIKELTHPTLPRPYLNCLDQDSPGLQEILERDYVAKPDMTAEYNFTLPVDDLLDHAAGYDLPLDVDQLVFGGKHKNGFFIEAGAGGGKKNS